ncbi:mechanosensitive ion channel family protein [Alkalicoccus luteus]|uniref:mechanosensitive ion channel family protein n=1 Tax=Alkalicoccus luteus TaxID=1237094 RepID=UPI004034BEE6
MEENFQETLPDVVEDIQQAFTWQEFAVGIGIFLLFLIFRKVFTTYIFKFIIAVSRKAPIETLTNVLLAFERPVRSFFVFIGIYAAFVYYPIEAGTEDFINQLFRTLIIFHVAWGLFNLTAPGSSTFNQIGKRFKIQYDDILLPFLSKLIRFAIVVMALSIIASEWNYNVSGFVAGLGLGGLAFALAAQESLSNFFGGVVIITEKPFKMGDWIKTPSVEGFVEDISFRSTKVRTFEDSLITVPNSTLANEPIENWTEMGKRQITFDIGVHYDTPSAKVRAAVSDIDAYLNRHTDIDDELIIVKFNSFGDSSLNLFLYFFTKPTGWVDHMNIREEVNFGVLDILEEHGMRIAYPTQTVHLQHSAEKADIHS